MIKYIIGWECVPGRDLAWYEAKKERMTPDEIAREIDRQYIFSVSGRVFMQFTKQRHLVKTPLKVNPELPIYCIWDFGKTNCVLYAQIDLMGRRRILRERLLTESDTIQQIAVHKNDIENWFPNHRHFLHICDPAGNWDDGRGLSTHVELLRAEKIFPKFDRITEIPTAERKKRARDKVTKDLQTTPGGEDAFLLYCSDSNEGCPTLLEALNSGYCYKQDNQGNYTDTIMEKHPYEDIIDCLLYFYLQAGARDAQMEPIKIIKPREGYYI